MKFTNLSVSTYIGDTFGSKVDGPGSVHALAISTSPRSFVDGRGDDVSESFVSDSKSAPSVEHAIAQGNPDSRLILDQSNLNHVNYGIVRVSYYGMVSYHHTILDS